MWECMHVSVHMHGHGLTRSHANAHGGAVCGDGTKDAGEECDDGNKGQGDGFCASLKSSNGGSAGCSGDSCKKNGMSDLTLQTCDNNDAFQLWSLEDTGNGKLFHSKADPSRCLYTGTSPNHGGCEPYTPAACDKSDARQLFKEESYDGSTIWRNVATRLAIDVNGWQNRVDNWVWGCGGSNGAKKFDPIAVKAPEAAANASPLEYVYEFSVDQNPAGPNLEICGIRGDGVRMTDEHVTMKSEPLGKCYTKTGGYECQAGVYGMTDDEPYPSSYTDCTYSQWRVNEGTTLFTIKSSEKVGKFEFDYFRPQYQPGWKIKENGVVISTTSPGPREAWPSPYTVAHAMAR